MNRVAPLPSLCRAALSVLALLAGCASRPGIEYHTLMSPAEAAPAAPASGLRFRIDSPVVVPSQVDQPQVVLRNPDGTVQVMEQQRWVAPLADEWRDAIAERLARRLGAIDVSRLANASEAPMVRLQLELQRFDSVPGGQAVQQALWSLRRPGEAAAALTCQVAAAEAGGNSVATLAAAHRRVAMRLADGMAAALQALQQGRPASCP
ncbi:PqiC family protein [Ideonella sp. BN130291]|uniref:PqiC family protein n=1 Tax=Ideonella sp. BN130291 TaxID=3112940 RepID=UPI002E273808|nr:PqiC family protein [Ideonella sp. BN130291]